ncbi:unnamed protein product [Diatraea saccharalis]|uniref:Uncharacterized protein n=1 Tax=Diatraea saccharalis TaxID=40085 RepID=A0A9N9RC85_9NEOP|nr:unnamed protein product [Diatraea saccharalis]
MGYNVPAILPFEYWLPFDPTQSVSCYMTMLTLQAWQAIVTIWLSMGGDLLICTILNHITLQYDLLAAKITKLKYLPIVRQGDPKHTFEKDRPPLPFFEQPPNVRAKIAKAKVCLPGDGFLGAMPKLYRSPSSICYMSIRKERPSVCCQMQLNSLLRDCDIHDSHALQ